MGRIVIDSPGDLKQALSDGHRWIVVPGNFWLGSGDRINLDDYVGVGSPFNTLRLEGGFGPNIAVLHRTYDASLGPLIYSESSAWDLHFTGIGFEDAGPVPGTESALCHFPALGDSYFKNCRWQCSRGIGLKVGPDMAENLCFVNCWFLSSRREGLYIDGMRALTVLAGSVEANGMIRDPQTDKCPQEKVDPAKHAEGTQWGYFIRGTTNFSRGGGIIMGTHLEIDQVANRKGIFLEYCRGVRLQYLSGFKSDLEEGTGSSENVVEGYGRSRSAIDLTFDTSRWNYGTAP